MGYINNKKIIDSLQTIKDVCDENYSDNGKCENCPFEVEGVCGITDLYPMNWRILEYKEFRALG